MAKSHKKPKSGNINVELEAYRRKRNARINKTPSFLKRLYGLPDYDKKD